MQRGQKKAGRRKRAVRIAAAALACSLCGACAPKECRDYTIQMEQYFVEYSDQYDYWDVLTVEYPKLSGIEEPLAGQIDRLLYDMAMEQIDYWHLYPDEDVRALQEEHYQIFCSDVHCEVPFHSQYLMSVHFKEVYAPISPVYYIHMTERSANVDLATGRQFKLGDILQIDEAFIGFWCERVREEGTYGDLIVNGSDTRQTFLEWFLSAKEDRQDAPAVCASSSEMPSFYIEEVHINDVFTQSWHELAAAEGAPDGGQSIVFTPFFYIDADKDLVIGISFAPRVDALLYVTAVENSFSAHFGSKELEPYRTDSAFWELLDQSEPAGEVLGCKDLQENRWLGKNAAVWGFREDIDVDFD